MKLQLRIAVVLPLASCFFASPQGMLLRKHEMGDFPVRRGLGEAKFEASGKRGPGNALSKFFGVHNPNTTFSCSFV